MRRALTGFVLLLLLCGCQQTLTATVTRFNALPLAPTSSQTFAVLAQGLQVGNLEFQHTAETVAAALEAHGFRVVSPADRLKADIVVLVQYGPAGARNEVIEYGPPRPWWGFPPYDVYTLYTQFLEVDLLDGTAWRRGEQHMLFQGRAYAETGAHDINVVMPYLVQALFDRFPGISGETIRVRVPVS